MNNLLPPVESLTQQRPFETLADWQAWVAEDWMHPIGTDEAQLHARYKLTDEAKELVQALASNDLHRIKDEAGDVLWTATAAGFNARILMRDVFYVDEDDDSPVLLTNLDEHFRISSRYWPVTEGLGDDIHFQALDLGQYAWQYHNLGKDTDLSQPPKHFSDAWAIVKRGRAIDNLRAIYMLSGTICRDILQIPIAEVMEHNRAKLLGRIERGEQITKPPAHPFLPGE